jgi:DNA-binding CsgD family transcriptional regulator/PAS domain-containing protein
MFGSCFTNDISAKIIDDLYAGTLDDAAWDRAILGISDLLHAAGAVLLGIDPRTGGIFRAENHRLDPAVIREYQDHWCREDSRLRAGFALPLGAPVTEQILRLPDWHRSMILNEFLLPNGTPYFMLAWLHKSAHKIVTLSLQRSRARGPFERADLDTYQTFLPHVTRALEIRDRLEQAQIRTETAVQRLAGSLTFGVIVLDVEGKVLESNPVAQEIFRAGDGVRYQPGRALWFRGAAGAQFAQLISADVPAAEGSDGFLHIPRSTGPSLSAVITPLPKNTVSWIGAEPRWLILLFDPERRMPISADLIARDLEISACEAEIAAMIADGHTTIDVAQRRGVTEGTVRAQLKSIFRKTSIRSQIELVRRITLGPSVHCDRSTTTVRRPSAAPITAPARQSANRVPRDRLIARSSPRHP